MLADPFAVSLGCDVAILAGGFGTRLRSAVGDLPKVLAPVEGSPFIFRLLEQLSSAGAERVVLCTGFGADEVARVVGHRYAGLSVEYSVEEQPLGTAGALRQAAKHFHSRLVLVLNGDSFLHADLSEFIAAYQEEKAPASLLVTRVEDAGRYGSVDRTGDGLVTAFREKESGGYPGWINAGVYLLPKEWIGEIPEGRAVSLEREMLPWWLSRGVRAVPVEGEFIDIGVPETFARAGQFFSSFRRATP